MKPSKSEIGEYLNVTIGPFKLLAVFKLDNFALLSVILFHYLDLQLRLTSDFIHLQHGVIESTVVI